MNVIEQKIMKTTKMQSDIKIDLSSARNQNMYKNVTGATAVISIIEDKGDGCI